MQRRDLRRCIFKKRAQEHDLKPTTILFDLDGTLTDPGLGITNSVMHALRRMGIQPPEREALYKFIGPPLKWSFHEYYGFDDAQCEEAIVRYREHFADKGLFENELYPAVPGMLQALRDAGLRLAVATSKPEPFSERIIDHFGLTPYFEAVCGSTLEETRTEKWEVIQYALELLGVTPAETVMVGDREHDVLGAKKCGVRCIGVLYGYGSREELEAAGTAAIAESPEQVAEIVLRGKF